METKYCKNKKCKRPLPEGYKHKYCENCRGKQAEDVKKGGVGLLGILGLVGSIALTVATKGKFNPKDK